MVKIFSGDVLDYLIICVLIGSLFVLMFRIEREVKQVKAEMLSKKEYVPCTTCRKILQKCDAKQVDIDGEVIKVGLARFFSYNPRIDYYCPEHAPKYDKVKMGTFFRDNVHVDEKRNELK